jgi:hypothetical protein
MAVTVRKVTLWRRHLDNRPGALAQVLEPLAGAGTDLQVAMGYRIPGQESEAVLELAPVSGRGSTDAARKAGLQPSHIPTLVVEGDNSAAVGRKFSAVFGFETQEDADRAAKILKRAGPARGGKKVARRKATSPRSRR